MFRYLWIVAGCLAMTPAVKAHSPLSGVVPADQSVHDTVPATVDLTFAAGMRLTRVALDHDGAPSGDLDIPPGGFVTEYTLPLIDLGPGTYTFTWRGLSADGHALQGSFGFSVN